MRKILISIVIVLGAALPVVSANSPVAASPASKYSGPYFGAGNLPPGCRNDAGVAAQMKDPALRSAAVCHRMRTGLNALDSPQVDVLVLVPVSPTAERDLRIMRQSVEMWEGGINYLAREMGLNWLADGMKFHITVDYFDPTGEQGGQFTTYPVVDPEIVVIATNPVGGIGIGVDPVTTFGPPLVKNQIPCNPVKGNPLEFKEWENLPGFNNHHGKRTGTYTEACNGSGGNVCFAINGAIDPLPDRFDIFGLFELVSHEIGHCLTIGHVGDGADGDWGAVPTNDIMAYGSGLPGLLTKCVSTLNVEGIALRMSNYLDVNGDGSVTTDDRLFANDRIGDGRHSFQVQRPSDHLYASSTGDPKQCPQPDLGLVPSGQRTNWRPTPAPASAPTPTTQAPSQPASSSTSPTTSSTSPPGSSASPTPSEPAPSGTSPDSAPRGTAPQSTTQPSGETHTPPTTSAPAPAAPATLTRIEGEDRMATAVAASRLAFGPGQAGAVVLARADQFADGLAGTSLAVAHRGPTLLTPGSGLDPRAAEELRRVLPAGGQVFVLGGPAALAPGIEAELDAMGYRAVRLAGGDRFETSVRIASAHPRPASILLATGRNFADALAAGAAAARARGLVLLTNDGALPPSVADYLARHEDVPRVAVGGPAALAAPGAERLAGADRFETSVIVARRFFSAPKVIGLASGVSFADALSGGALMGHLAAPLILTAPTELPAGVSSYIKANRSSIDNVMVIGGQAAVAPAVAKAAVDQASR